MQELVIDKQSYPVINLAGRPAAILDRHVAEIYNVKTEDVNRAVTRNLEKFPAAFMYRLTKEELAKVLTNCQNLDNLKYSPHLPQAFTWEGCNMLATILKSDVAAQRAIQIVRGFTLLERSKETVAASVQKTALPPQLLLPEEKAARIASAWLEMAQMLEVPKYIAQVEAIKATKAKTNIDYSLLLLTAPAQDAIPEEAKLLEVTEIGKQIGLSAKEVNLFLRDQDLQCRVGRTWQAIGEGEKYSQSHQWFHGNKSGFNLKWNVTFVKSLWAKRLEERE